VAPEEAASSTVLDPARVRGIEREALDTGDAGREAAAGALFIPRNLVKLVFLASGVTASLMRDEQVVPRVEELLSPKPGSFSVLPSLFLDTRRRASAGAQVLGNLGFAAVRLAGGFGGIHDGVGEARVGFALPRPLPFVLSFEGLIDTRSTLDYYGVGQEPGTDPRNLFLRKAATTDGVYFEERIRGLVTLGARIGQDFEWFVSSSILRSLVEDTPGGGPGTITSVFQPGSVAGAPSLSAAGCGVTAAPTVFRTALPTTSCPASSLITYTELAVRLDTRASKSRPSPGVLVGAYGGVAAGVGDDPSRFYRLGAQAAGFISVRRTTNILSPKLILDGTVRPAGAAPVPFTQLVGQPEFRGIDSRIDALALVASLDYRWSMIRYLGPRIFLDMAQVGPSMGALLKAPPRFATGFGFDFFSNSTELGQAMMSFSSEGVRVLFTFGVPTQFGDRQHRR